MSSRGIICPGLWQRDLVLRWLPALRYVLASYLDEGADTDGQDFPQVNRAGWGVTGRWG
jgi:hypothetical protein